jgi:hypothetical protein
MDLYADNKLREAREKLSTVVKLDPNHITARKRLEEINERLAALKEQA